MDNLKLENVIKSIEDLARYKDGGYNGEIGTPASTKTIRDAIIVASKLDYDWIPFPFISLSADGEISFWWDLENVKLGVNIFGDGTYAYYGKTVNKNITINRFSSDETDINIALPLELIKELLFAKYSNRNL